MAGEFMKIAKGIGKKHGSEILIAVGCLGMGSAIISAWRNGTKASQVIKEESRIARQEGEEYTKVDCVKDTWKYWLPPTLMFLASTACLVGSNRISSKQKAALIAACKLSETALSEYKREVVKQIGAKKEQKIYDGLAEEHYKTSDKPVKEKIYPTGKGNYLCYDWYSNTWFYSDWNAIKAAEIEINKRMITDMEMWASLNDFYDEIGIPRIGAGDDIGWNADRPIEVIKSYTGDSDDGEPALEIRFRCDPRIDYSKLM